MPLADEVTYQSPVNSIGTLAWQNAVINRTTNTPPGSPTTGDRYIVSTSPTGAWAGKSMHIAQWNGTTWVLFAPINGQTVYCTADNAWYDYSSTLAKWVVHESVTQEAVLTSPDISFLGLSHTAVPVPEGAVFFPDTCGVMVSTATAVTGYPKVSFGDSINGNSYYLASSFCPNLNGAWSRQDFPTLATQQGTQGTNSVTADVTVPGTGTTLVGRFYWRGIMIQK